GKTPRHPLAPSRLPLEARQRDALLAKPEQRLAHTAGDGELFEDQSKSPLHSLVRMLLDSAVSGSDVAHRQPEDQSATAGLGEQSFVGPLPDPAQLRLAHRPFQSEQEAIIKLPRIVDALAVDDESVREPAEIEELVPVAIVAGQA